MYLLEFTGTVPSVPVPVPVPLVSYGKRFVP